MINTKLKSISKNKILVLIICILLLIFTYLSLNYRELVAVYNLNQNISKELENMEIVLGGEATGIKLLATGVLVMGLDRGDTDLKIGDVILKANDSKVESNDELVEITKNSDGNVIKLLVDRQGINLNIDIIPQKDETSNEYKLGIWVKDSSAGVGTITFYDKKSRKFAALGHGVTETKENYILPITSGGITKTKIYSIKKGESKDPGELRGIVSNELIGQIIGNTDKGIYGELTDMLIIEKKNNIEILPKTKIKEGNASIFCTLDDNIVQEYSIKIEKVLLTSTGNKNMIIKITDEKLLEKTGGIIQGMSGSPIVQDGKLIGAVTHVFLNDPTRGYGVFIENMIEDMLSAE